MTARKGRRIGDEAKADVKQLETLELAVIVEKTLDDILGTSYLNTQSGFYLVVYIVVEQFRLDLLREDVIGETLNAHIAELFDMDAATNRVFEKILMWSSFIAPITMFVQRKTETTIADKDTVFAKA